LGSRFSFTAGFAHRSVVTANSSTLVAEASKQGFVYLFDRVTGDSLFPLESHSYPASTISGEVAAKE